MINQTKKSISNKNYFADRDPLTDPDCATIKILKSGEIREVSLTGNSHPIVTRGSHASRAPPRLTLPAFLNLHGIKNKTKTFPGSISSGGYSIK